MSIPRQQLCDAGGSAVSARFQLLPRNMFQGHRAEFRGLLPAHKPRLRLRASRFPHSHVEKSYDELYDPAPDRKKAKLRAARLHIGLAHSIEEYAQRRHSLTPSIRGKLAERVVCYTSDCFNCEKENTSRLMSEYKRRAYKHSPKD